MRRLTQEEIKKGFETLERNLLLKGLCRITIVNATPPNWNISITTAATEFWNRDGTKYTDSNQNINIGAGSSTYTESNDATKCVGEARTIVWVVAPGKQPVSFGVVTTCPANECLLSGTVKLSAKSSVTIDELNRGNVLEFIDIVD